jgi:hypothetical protein
MQTTLTAGGGCASHSLVEVCPSPLYEVEEGGVKGGDGMWLWGWSHPFTFIFLLAFFKKKIVFNLQDI